MFKKIFGSSVKIDTRLYNNSVQQGGILEGEVFIQAEKDIELKYIDLVVMVSYKDGDTYGSMKLHHHRIEDSFYLRKGDKVNVPFNFVIPLDMPVSTRDTKLYIKTEAETNAEGLFERTDKDYFQITPGDTLSRLINVLERAGFRFSEAEFEVNYFNANKTANGRNYLQEFDFKPGYNSKNRRTIDEFELAVLDYDTNGNLLIKFSIEKKGFMGNFGDKVYRVEVEANQSDAYYQNVIQSFLNRY